MDLYKYRPLSLDGAIRILELCPGDDSDSITCCLREGSISTDQLGYDALSYSWGDATVKIPVYCDAAAIHITRNLHSALRSLRSKSKSIYLWVDALCIDQMNLNEKGHQISIMRLIYQRAARVRIWLGGDDDSSLVAIPLITSIFTLTENDYIPILSGGEVVFQKATSTVLDPNSSTVFDEASHQALTVSDQQWRAIGRFLCRPYFSRLWVLQEATANTTVTAFCGTHSLDFEIITGFAEWLCNQNLRRLHFRLLARCNNINKGYYHASLMREIKFRRIGVLEMLQVGRECQCADARDKVYGLLSFFPQKAVTAFGRMGYEASVQDVYKATVNLSIESTQSLDVLRYVHHSGQLDHTFPSWVPRWDIWHACPKFGLLEWQASKDLKPKIVKSEDKDTLCACGVPFGSVACVGYRYGTIEDNKPFVDMFTQRYNVSCWAEFFALKETYPGGKDLCQQFSLMLTASNFSSGQRVDGPQAVADFAAFLYEHSKNGWEDISLLGIPVLKNAAELALLEETAEPGDWKRFHTASGAGYQTTPVYMTKEGYFGLGPDLIEPGDICSLLFGGSTPFILRPIDRYFAFMGESYTQGVMDGEVIHSWLEGTLLERKFNMR